MKTSKVFIGQALKQVRIIAGPIVEGLAAQVTAVAPVDQAQMIARPNVAAFAISSRGHRDDAVVGSLALFDDLVGQEPFRRDQRQIAHSRHGEIANARLVANLLVKGSTTVGAEIVKRLMRQVEKLQDRFEQTLQMPEAPIG